MVIEITRNITIETLEQKSPLVLNEWIAIWNDEGEPISINGNIVKIGEIEYRPIAWKCPGCGRWNYELSFWDNAGAMAICGHCDYEDEF